ncbi:MAG: CsbD family protein [Ilumatobacteraceae bacterium]
MSGEFDQAKGRVKQAVGDLTDDKDMAREGERDETAGKVKDKVDDAKDKVDDAIDSVTDKMK